MNAIAVRKPEKTIKGTEPTIKNQNQQKRLFRESSEASRNGSRKASREIGGEKPLCEESRGKRGVFQLKKSDSMGNEATERGVR